MHADAPDAGKDERLQEDIRLLGRILGDTVREQEGDAVFDIVEHVRQTAVRFARDGDPAARTELADLLDPLPRDTTQAVVRAFSYFLQLANIAEDEHHIRRRRAHDLAGSPPREGSLVYALDALSDRSRPAGSARRLLRPRARRPGAHRPPDRGPAPEPDPQPPRHRPPAGRARAPPPDARGSGRQRSSELQNAILTLWQSRMLRPVRLKVIDEVKNGITYFSETFFTELPRLYIRATQLLQKRYPDRIWALPPFFRVGSWIGGDRDGNPFVTADILREALRLQSAAAIDHYLE